MNEIIYTNRTKLLRTFTGMKFSQSAKHEVMLLFGSIETHSEKEEAARRAIPLVEACKTEEEAIQAVSGVIRQMQTDK